MENNQNSKIWLFFCGLSKIDHVIWWIRFQPGLQRTCDRMPGQWEIVQKPAAVQMLAFPAMSSSSTWTILKHQFQADLLVTWGGLKLGRCFFSHSIFILVQLKGMIRYTQWCAHSSA